MATKEWYLVERPRALASVYLTRRDDVKLLNPGDELKSQGINILVHLKNSTESPLGQFGVALDASVEPTTKSKLNKTLQPVLQSILQSGGYPYPVCLFYFTMQDNGSYFTWVVEPIVTAKGQAELLRREQAHCKLLNRKALNTIIDSVYRWYDAFSANLTASGS